MWRASTSSSSTTLAWWERAAEALWGQHQLHGHCSKGGCLQGETLEWKVVVDPTEAGSWFPTMMPGHYNQCGWCGYQSTARTAREIPAVLDGIHRWLGGAWYPGVQRGENRLSLVIVYYFLEPKTKKEIFSKPKISVLRFLVPSLAYLALIVFLASAFSHRAFGWSCFVVCGRVQIPNNNFLVSSLQHSFLWSFQMFNLVFPIWEIWETHFVQHSMNDLHSCCVFHLQWWVGGSPF